MEETVEVGGSVTIIAAFATCIIELLSQYTFNDYAQGVLTLGGIVFLFYKIKNAKLDAKLKQRILKEGGKIEPKEKQRLFKRTKKK